MTDHDHHAHSGGRLPGCTHPAERDAPCHRSPLLPCPDHFSHLSADALAAAEGGRDRLGFTLAARHLTIDRYLPAVWFTWLSMMARWCTPAGTSIEAVTEQVVAATNHAAANARYDNDPTVAALLRTGVLAALNGDPDNAEAALRAANATLDVRGMLSLLASLAGSVAAVVHHNPAATADALYTHHILGSQIFHPAGMVALPYLADAVDAVRTGDVGQGLLDAVDRLLGVDRPEVVVAGASMAARLLGQSMAPDMQLITGSTDDTYDPADVFGTTTGVGLLDWRTATLENTPEGLMIGVWAMRAGDAYAGASSLDDMARRSEALVDAHGNHVQFTFAVLIGACQMIGNGLAAGSPDRVT